MGDIRNTGFMINLQKKYCMKRNIALITGGWSGEIEISLKSAAVIKNHLDKNIYNVYLIVIERDNWFYHHDENTKIPVDKNNFSTRIDGQEIRFDCTFIAIHGTPGEDGKLQGYFDMLKIPYTACDVFTSSLTFNKYFTNHIVENLGVKVGKMQIIKTGQEFNQPDIIKSITFPCFVKPNKGGSSVGISRVNKAEELQSAIEKAFMHDDEVLVQEFIKGREIACGLIRNNDKMVILPLCEIISKKEFFDYEAKYTDGLADEIVPAPINENLAEKCREISVFLYENLNCKGIVRFDYILDGDEFYFLEVNTIPGLSEGSIVPKMANHIGMSIKELFTMMVEEAIHWHHKREKYY